MRFILSPKGRLDVEGAFDDVIESLTLPTEVDGVPVTEVESNAFYKVHIKKLVIPGQYTRIFARAFRRCYIEELEILPGLGRLAFDFQSFSYNNLKKVVFPERVWYIGKSSFELNTELEEIEIQGAEQIYSKAFEGCMNVSQLTFTADHCVVLDNAFSKEIENIDLSFDAFVEFDEKAFNGELKLRKESVEY